MSALTPRVVKRDAILALNRWRDRCGRQRSRPAKDGPGKLGSNSQTVGGYAELIVEVMVWKVALICEPRLRPAAMMPTAIRAAMRPYSMAVAPDSSLTKRMTWFCMMPSQMIGRLPRAPMQATELRFARA